jgi:hypothetical protein
MSKRTITLTDHAPITIEEENWPVIAADNDKEYDGQVECQANRISQWWVRVRQHADSRAIVYAGYEYNTHFQSERSYSAKRGVMLPPGSDLIAAIREVADDIAGAECAGDDASRWPTLVAECIADFPAEEIV